MQENKNPIPEPTSRLELIGQLRSRLIEVLPDAETLWNQREDTTISFRGHLAVDPERAYTLLRGRFAEIGYTPLLREQEGYNLVVALPHVFKPQPTRWIVNLVLLVLTMITTTLMGALLEQSEQLAQNWRLFFEQPALLLTGLPASLTIMGILVVHELAHYVVARKHNLDRSLPYFIPIPLGLGTLGAIIFAREPWENRKALFDVGIAGPLAGFVVALPLFFIGLMLSPAQPPLPDGATLGSPLLLRWIENLVYLLRGIPADHEIYVNAMTFAAWFGLVITGFNLLPIGQLDGGHIAHAMLGRWAGVLGIFTLLTMFALGAVMWKGWFIWAAFVLFSGWQHPAPLNALAPLGKKRAVIGALVWLLTLLLFTPAPLPF